MRNRTVSDPIRSEHVVHFFDTDESRAETVAAFLAEGYAAGEPLLIIARPAHWTAMIEPLEALGVPVHEALVSGRPIVRDAADTLRRLHLSGSAGTRRAEQMVLEMVRSLLPIGPRIRAYGEMVDILAQRDELNEAIALETLWNAVSDQVPLALLCGYSAAHFVSTATHGDLREICRAHTDVRQHVQDPLASWLLTAAHNGTAVGATLRH